MWSPQGSLKNLPTRGLKGQFCQINLFSVFTRHMVTVERPSMGVRRFRIGKGNYRGVRGWQRDGREVQDGKGSREVKSGGGKLHVGG